MINYTNKKSGFTLIEMLVAIFIFSIVMVIATGAIFTIVSANKTSQALKSVLDNLNSALDDMSNTMRYGSYYYCGVASSASDDIAQSLSRQCAPGHGSQVVSFINKDGDLVTYQFVSQGIQMSKNNLPFVPLTASEVVIKDMHFYVSGSSQNEGQTQPQVLITLTGSANINNGNNQTTFNIETMVTQRNPVCKAEMITLGLCKNN